MSLLAFIIIFIRKLVSLHTFSDVPLLLPRDNSTLIPFSISVELTGVENIFNS